VIFHTFTIILGGFPPNAGPALLPIYRWGYCGCLRLSASSTIRVCLPPHRRSNRVGRHDARAHSSMHSVSNVVSTQHQDFHDLTVSVSSAHKQAQQEVRERNIRPRSLQRERQLSRFLRRVHIATGMLTQLVQRNVYTKSFRQFDSSRAASISCLPISSRHMLVR